MRRSIGVAVIALALGGCYKVNVSTGIAPGANRFQEKWAPGWIAGLVSPDPVEGATECGSAGVARVESKISFLNGLVSVLTFNIFAPMEIVVTCGQGGGEEQQQDVGDASPTSAAPGANTAAR